MPAQRLAFAVLTNHVDGWRLVQDVEAAIDRLRIRRLEVRPDPPMEHPPNGERQALVRDLLGHAVDEEPGVVGLAVQRDEIAVPERLEVPERLRAHAPDGVGQSAATLVETERVRASVIEAVLYFSSGSKSNSAIQPRSLADTSFGRSPGIIWRASLANCL